MGTILGPKYIPYTYMDPLGMGNMCTYTRVVKGWRGIRGGDQHWQPRCFRGLCV